MAVQTGEGTVKATFNSCLVAEDHVGSIDGGQGDATQGVACVPTIEVFYSNGLSGRLRSGGHD